MKHKEVKKSRYGNSGRQPSIGEHMFLTFSIHKLRHQMLKIISKYYFVFIKQGKIPYVFERVTAEDDDADEEEEMQEDAANAGAGRFTSLDHKEYKEVVEKLEECELHACPAHLAATARDSHFDLATLMICNAVELFRCSRAAGPNSLGLRGACESLVKEIFSDSSEEGEMSLRDVLVEFMTGDHLSLSTKAGNETKALDALFQPVPEYGEAEIANICGGVRALVSGILDSERLKEIVVNEAQFTFYEGEDMQNKLDELSAKPKELSLKIELFFYLQFLPLIPDLVFSVE